MSIVRSCSVFCDGTDPETGARCASWAAETTAGSAEARRVARGEGWTRRRGLDFCPFPHDPGVDA